MHALLDDGYKHTVDDVICMLHKWATYIHDAKLGKPLHKQFGKVNIKTRKRIYKYRHSKKSNGLEREGEYETTYIK